MTHPSIVFVLHVILVVYMCIYPLVSIHSHDLLLHAFMLCSIMLHWLFNSDVCALTEIEYGLRKMYDNKSTLRRDTTCFGSVISPVYKVSNIVVYKLTILLTMYTVYKSSVYHVA
jgi:hypothetical protein